MDVQNIGVGGGTIAAGQVYGDQSERFAICTSLQNLSANNDFIIMEGGINDSSLPVTMGEISTGFDAELNNETFCGGLEYMFKYAVTNFSGKKLGFIIPHNANNGFSFGGTYYEKAIELAKKWGIPVCDLNVNIPPLGRIASLKSTYTVSGDGWHPNELAYQTFYLPKIAAFLESLLTKQ